MAAKATTLEQAAMFHQSQIGHPDCFDGCCLHAAITRAEQAEAEVRDYDASFELYDNAMRRATKMWQEESGNKEVPRIWPDGAKLVAWLISKMDWMRRDLCSCGFTDFDEPSAHHPECNYRVAALNQLIDEVGEAGGITHERPARRIAE